ATFEPTLAYRLGLGGRHDFLVQEGELARGAQEIITDRISSGATFPHSISATLTYGLVRTFQFTRVGSNFLESQIRAKEWPVGNVRWSTTIRNGPLALVGLGTSFRRVEGTTVIPRTDGGDAAVSLNRTKTLSPDLNLAFRSGLTVTLSYTMSVGTTTNNGNTTETDQQSLTGTLNYSLPLPRSISRRRRLIRLSITGLATKLTSCLQRSADPECLTVSDVFRQEARATIDTDVSQLLRGGLSASYTINDVRHLDRKSSQIIISLNFSLSLFAGDFR
ncbi:MAG: hypothetical protein V3T16_07405, partial [Gemmatimonadales bacterium]